ncbi:MAG: TetR/AcrR family transcriptional regulator [Actinomycetes bacterium]
MPPHAPDDAQPHEPQSRRGRPRRFAPPGEQDHLPLEAPLTSLSPTAQAMLAAGRTILVERGYRALTLEAVAHEAGASKSSLVAHFGSRVGFIGMLFDSLLHDGSVTLGEALADRPTGSVDVDEYVSAVVDLYTDVEAESAFLEIAGNAIGDAALSTRLAALLDWYCDITMSRLAACAGSDALSRDELRTLASLFGAVEDGLALRHSLDPDGFDARPEFELFGRLMKLYFAERASSAE